MTYKETPSGLYELLGDPALLQAHKDALLGFLDVGASKTAHARLMQAAQLGRLLNWCEQNKVPIRALESGREPGGEGD